MLDAASLAVIVGASVTSAGGVVVALLARASRTDRAIVELRLELREHKKEAIVRSQCDQLMAAAREAQAGGCEAHRAVCDKSREDHAVAIGRLSERIAVATGRGNGG